MHTSKNVFNSPDFRPEVLAAILIESGNCLPENISIVTKWGDNYNLAREVLEIRKLQNDKIEIVEKSKSKLKQELETVWTKETGHGSLLRAVEEELGHFRVLLELRERKMVMASNRVWAKFCMANQDLQIPEKIKLAYYKPYISVIQKDIHLIARCSSALLGYPVIVQPATPLIKEMDKKSLTPLGQWQLGLNSVAGGKGPSQSPCFLFRIGPLEAEDIPDFLPGGGRRNFIDKGICPMFLPDSSDYQVVLITKVENFVIHPGKTVSFLGINSRLS